MNAVVRFLNTRAGMSLAGWGLLFLATLAWPTPLTSSGAVSYDSAGWYVFANLTRPDLFPDSGNSLLPRQAMFVLPLLTNILFLFAVWFRDQDNLSRAFQGVLLAALVIDILVPIFLHEFALMPGYWLWLAAVACIVWAFIARPAKGQAPRGYVKAQWSAAIAVNQVRNGLPEIVWAWLGWLAFWSCVSVLSHWEKPDLATRPSSLASQAVKATALTGYVNDFAGVLHPGTAERLGASLAKFEQETSSQVAVAIYSGVPDVAIEDFTLEVAEKSRLGRKGLDNGAILSIFARERVARLEVGYGLEGTLTDARAHGILESVLAPAWNGSDQDKAVESALASVMAAVRDDYTAGRMPGALTVFWHQLLVEIPRFAKGLIPTLVAMPTDARFGISFFGTFLLFGLWDGFIQTRALAGNAIIAIGNLKAGRPFSAGTQSVRFESVYDSLKIMLFVGFFAYAAVGIIVIAGGGAFGSAGASLHW